MAGALGDVGLQTFLFLIVGWVVLLHQMRTDNVLAVCLLPTKILLKWPIQDPEQIHNRLRHVNQEHIRQLNEGLLGNRLWVSVNFAVDCNIWCIELFQLTFFALFCIEWIMFSQCIYYTGQFSKSSREVPMATWHLTRMTCPRIWSILAASILYASSRGCSLLISVAQNHIWHRWLWEPPSHDFWSCEFSAMPLVCSHLPTLKEHCQIDNSLGEVRLWIVFKKQREVQNGEDMNDPPVSESGADLQSNWLIGSHK